MEALIVDTDPDDNNAEVSVGSQRRRDSVLVNSVEFRRTQHVSEFTCTERGCGPSPQRVSVIDKRTAFAPGGISSHCDQRNRSKSRLGTMNGSHNRPPPPARIDLSGWVSRNRKFAMVLVSYDKRRSGERMRKRSGMNHPFINPHQRIPPLDGMQALRLSKMSFGSMLGMPNISR